MPTDETGTWIGERGHGTFVPRGTRWRIRFESGRPNFRNFVEKKHRFTNVEGLTGKGDRGIMLNAVIAKFGKQFGFTTQAGARAWLNQYETPYGTGLELHHSGPDQFQLVPKAVHRAAQHGGFRGSASQLRKQK